MSTEAIDIRKAAEERRDQLVERLLEATEGAFAVFSIHLGDKLGWYRELAASGPLTADELAFYGVKEVFRRYDRIVQQK